MSNIMGLGVVGAPLNSGPYSPAKEKAVMRGPHNRLLAQRLRQLLGHIGSVRIKIFLPICAILAIIVIAGRAASIMGWDHHSLQPKSSPPRKRYTVLINTWKRNDLLKKSVKHYAGCSSVDAVNVVWSETEPPSESLKEYLRKTVDAKSQSSNKPDLRFNLNKVDNLNNRFRPIEDLRTDAVFSVDDDVIFPCSTLEFAFSVWQSAPDTMVGFVPRMHWIDSKKTDMSRYTYGGWWSVWWMGTYSMVLSKAAFLHKKYLDMYTNQMPAAIREYVISERNCEDIAMSFLVANATGAPPIWVKGKIFEIGSTGISSLKGHSERRTRCLNDFVALFGHMPLVASNVKAVSARDKWFW
uniref:Glycosyl transferase 64 domain-containing protein n=1 Tax=Araucaria cunninghamii TaxID=56994 RepID=A0A0D6QV88_ARACU